MDNLIEKYLNILEEEEYKKLIDIIMDIFIIIAPSFSIIFLFERKLFLELDLFRLITLCIIINIMIFFIYYVAIYLKTVNKKLLNIHEIRYLMEEEVIKKNKINEEIYSLKRKNDELRQKRYLDDNDLEDIKEIEEEIDIIDIKLKAEEEIMNDIDDKISKHIEEIEHFTQKKIIVHTVLETSVQMVSMTTNIWIVYGILKLLKIDITLESKINAYMIFIGVPVLIYIIISVVNLIKIKYLSFKSCNKASLKKRTS